jgi:hypothetical protein
MRLIVLIDHNHHKYSLDRPLVPIQQIPFAPDPARSRTPGRWCFAALSPDRPALR